LSFRNVVEVIIIMGTLPLAIIGSLWLTYLMGFNFSVAIWVGFIALAGVAVEIGVIMLVYLNQAYQKLMLENPGQVDRKLLRQSIIEGASMRVRPIMMTAASIILGLLPILFGGGSGSELMSGIATPMVGGMVSALILTLIVLPLVYFLWRSATIKSN